MGVYVPGYAAVRVWLDTDPDLRTAVRHVAGSIADRARLIAPIRTGRYKASIHVRDARAWDGRIAADVVADTRYAAVLEVGRRDLHSRGQHILRRAAETLPPP